MIEINWKPDRRRLRQFGAAALAVFAAVGAWIFWRQSLFGLAIAPGAATAAAVALWVAAAACGLLAALAPGAIRPLYVGLSAVGYPIGLVVSHVVMAAVFFGVVTPIALVMRLVGRDPLCRRFDRQARTYWVERRPPDDVNRYFNQF